MLGAAAAAAAFPDDFLPDEEERLSSFLEVGLVPRLLFLLLEDAGVNFFEVSFLEAIV